MIWIASSSHNQKRIKTIMLPSWERMIRSHEGLTLETSALKLFTVANLHYQLSP